MNQPSAAAPLLSSKSNEQYTPPAIVEAARSALGGRIDLDPASCVFANEVVQAGRFFIERDSGLLKDWGPGPQTVFLNPPGGFVNRETFEPAVRGMSSCVAWWWRLLEEYREGRVSEAVFYTFRLDVLQNMQTDATYEPPQAFPFCIFKDRPRHWTTSTPKAKRGLAGQPTHACAAFYLGPNAARFAEAFAPLGYVRC